MRINSESIAYASQTPWILNATIRDNIIFGLPINEARYEKVMNICQLLHDLTLLEKGDLTEIGERGINLSGALNIFEFYCKLKSKYKLKN